MARPTAVTALSGKVPTLLFRAGLTCQPRCRPRHAARRCHLRRPPPVPLLLAWAHASLSVLLPLLLSPDDLTLRSHEANCSAADAPRSLFYRMSLAAATVGSLRGWNGWVAAPLAADASACLGSTRHMHRHRRRGVTATGDHSGRIERNYVPSFTGLEPLHAAFRWCNKRL